MKLGIEMCDKKIPRMNCFFFLLKRFKKIKIVFRNPVMASFFFFYFTFGLVRLLLRLNEPAKRKVMNSQDSVSNFQKCPPLEIYNLDLLLALSFSSSLEAVCVHVVVCPFSRILQFFEVWLLFAARPFLSVPLWFSDWLFLTMWFQIVYWPPTK